MHLPNLFRLLSLEPMAVYLLAGAEHRDSGLGDQNSLSSEYWRYWRPPALILTPADMASSCHSQPLKHCRDLGERLPAAQALQESMLAVGVRFRHRCRCCLDSRGRGACHRAPFFLPLVGVGLLSRLGAGRPEQACCLLLLLYANGLILGGNRSM